MENNKLEQKIKQQARTIKRLKKKIQKLEDDLYLENEKIPLNQKTLLRVKDIVKMYSVGKSTIWLYVKQKKIKAIKTSGKVTTFDAKEIEDFFMHKTQKQDKTRPISLKILLTKSNK